MPKSPDAFLAALLVVEIGERTACGACGSLLAHLGADVVIVEPPMPSTRHKWINRPAVSAGKRSVVASRDEPGRSRLLTLLDRADVLLLSSDLDAWERQMWERSRPRHQVICDLTAYGHTGPLAGVAHPEPLVQAMSGVAATTGTRDGPPAFVGAPLLDMETGVYAASAIVAALRVRRRDGVGQRIDMALYDVAVNALLTFIPLHWTGQLATRSGNRHPALSPWNAYRAQDGWVLVCGPSNEQWRRLCETIGRPELVQDVRFLTPSSRLAHVDDVDEAVGRWTASRTVGACVALLGGAAIPAGPIVPLDRLSDEPNLALRGTIQTAIDPETGRPALVPASPFRTSDSPPEAMSIPRRGADDSALDAPAAERPDRVTGDPPAAHRALDGVRVVEIGMNTVGPLACRQLGALGADVIKIEPPTGDTNRLNAPLREDGQSYVFALSNTDKRGLVLNLKEAQDREKLFKLLAGADILIQNLKPGTLERLGLGADDVRRRCPQLVYCSISGFGRKSAYPGRPALDSVVQAMSGVMSATPVNGVPTKAGLSVADQLGGQFALLATLAALHRKETSGEGAYLDLAMQDLAAWATQALWNGAEPASAPYRIVAAGRAHVAVERANTEPRRWTPVLGVAEVLAHPQLAARGLLVERPTRDGSRWKVLGPPFRLLSTPAQVRTVMSRLGAEDDEVAAEFGLTDSTAEVQP